MEDQKRILEEVFGESSSSEAEYENEQSDLIHTDREKKNPSWERVKEIDGLWLCSDFLSPEQQCRLLSSIQRGWLIQTVHRMTGARRPIGVILPIAYPPDGVSQMRGLDHLHKLRFGSNV